jgi:hypothetical protein
VSTIHAITSNDSSHAPGGEQNPPDSRSNAPHLDGLPDDPNPEAGNIVDPMACASTHDPPRRAARSAEAALACPGWSAPVSRVAAVSPDTIAALVAALGSGARPYDRWSFAEKRHVSQTLRRLADDIDKEADAEIAHLL